MEDIIVTTSRPAARGGEDRLTENVTLNFAKVKYEYKEQKPDGSGGTGDRDRAGISRPASQPDPHVAGELSSACADP